jgi:hypothetical protein
MPDSAERTLEFIGTVRQRLFISESHEWNGLVRDITARYETAGMLVDAERVSVALADFYRDRVHWLPLTLPYEDLHAIYGDVQ